MQIREETANISEYKVGQFCENLHCEGFTSGGWSKGVPPACLPQPLPLLVNVGPPRIDIICPDGVMQISTLLHLGMFIPRHEVSLVKPRLHLSVAFIG